MNLKKVLKIIAIILVVIIIAFLIHTIRNYVIITNLQNSISKYAESRNFYIKSIANENNGTIVTMEYYKKDDKEVVFLERNLNGEITKISMYNNGERTNTYTETEDKKIAQLDSENIMSINIYNNLETDNKLQTFLGSIFTRIKSEKFNGKDCYVISEFLSSMSLTNNNQENFIEKDTGLLVKINLNGMNTEKEYEFNNVDDSIFIEPDISEYTLK